MSISREDIDDHLVDLADEINAEKGEAAAAQSNERGFNSLKQVFEDEVGILSRADTRIPPRQAESREQGKNVPLPGEGRKNVQVVAPQEVVLAARATMGGVDLDPYASTNGNRLVQAARFYNREHEDIDSLIARDWSAPAERRVFLGPVGGAVVTRRLLNKLLREYRKGHVSEAVIWLPHNESLCRLPWLWTFPMCIPFRRFRPLYYDTDLDEFRTISPAFWSPVIYLPPSDHPGVFDDKLMRFYAAFSTLGRIVHDTENGSDDWEDAYEAMVGTTFNYRA